MGFRVRKSFKIAPGVRISVSPKSIGINAGVRGARVSANSSGRVTRTVGIPGTGISHVTSSTTGRGTAKAAAPQRVASATAPAAITKPGLFAPAWEKALYKSIKGTTDGPTLHRLVQEYPAVAQTISLVEVLRVSFPSQDTARAKALLDWLHNSGYEPREDAFLNRYMPGVTLTVPVTAGIAATMPLGRDTLGLLLAEIEQQDGNPVRATEVVESLEPTTIAAVSLAELYAEQSRWNDVVELTDGVTNEDEPSTYLLIQRGIALREQGFFEASRESFKEALRVRSRPVDLRRLASIGRGLTYLAEGKRAMAKKDFERVLAEDSTYPGLAELLKLTNP